MKQNKKKRTGIPSRVKSSSKYEVRQRYEVKLREKKSQTKRIKLHFLCETVPSLKKSRTLLLIETAKCSRKHFTKTSDGNKSKTKKIMQRRAYKRIERKSYKTNKETTTNVLQLSKRDKQTKNITTTNKQQQFLNATN